MDSTPAERGAALRAYTILEASPSNFSIVPKGSPSAMYTASIKPTIDMLHPNSITLYSLTACDRVVGAVRMYHGKDTIEVVLGDPEDFAGHENCFWEHIHIRHDEPSTTTYGFGLGLGDDLRRDFEWQLTETHQRPTGHTAMPGKRSHGWAKSGIVRAFERTHFWGSSATAAEKPDAEVEHWCLNLVDRDSEETVAKVMPHEIWQDSESVKGGEIETSIMKCRFIIYRDFWERGRYEEEWDRMVLLSGLAVLERSALEFGLDDCTIK